MPYVVDTSHLGKKSSAASVLGSLSSAGLSALIKLVLEGRIGQVPTGKSNLQLPSGANATPGPGLQSQLNAGQLQSLIQSGQFPQGTTTTPQTRWGIQPDLSRQLQQQQLARAPLERQKLEADIRNQSALSGYYNSLSGGVAPDKLQQLEDDALAGDEDAIIAYRKLKALGIF